MYDAAGVMVMIEMAKHLFATNVNQCGIEGKEEEKNE